MRTFASAVAALVPSFLALSALAQAPGSAPAAPADTPPPAAAPQPPAEPAPPPPPPAEATPNLDAAAEPPPGERPLPERMSEAEGKLEGLSESIAATQATLSPIAKLKLSGYIQGRYEWRNDSVSGVDGSGRATSFDRWRVRRARLKALYAGDNAEYMLQLDATTDTVALRDAEATFVDTWTPFGIRLTVGQFKVPFGFEVLQSSGEREMPERARVIGALFPGERDRGLRLQARYGILRFSGAVINGNAFTGDSAVFGSLDQNRFSDLVGRVGADLEFLVVGVSGYFGEKLNTTAGTPASSSGMDTNGDGMISGDEIVLTPATGPTMRRFGVWRLGADAQLYYDIAGVGGLTLRGEVIVGKETHREFRGANADPCRDLRELGWIATLVQNFGDRVGVVARLDQWNPNRGVAEGTSTTCMTAASNAATDKITTLGGGLLFYISGNLKATAVYEHLWRPARLAASPMLAPNSWVPSDAFTFQLQAKF